MEIEPDLTLCTVARRHPQSLLRLLRSIEDTADPVSWEIVVAEIEAGSATGLADRVPGMLVIHTPGLSRLAALNRAIRHGRGRYTAVVEPEMILLPECLKRLVDFMDDTPDAGLATPRIISASGAGEPSVGRFPGIFATLFGHCWVDQGPPPGRTPEIDWSSRGLHLLRRECLSDIGLLDEALPVCAELDLYRRSQRQGWHNHLVAEATVVSAATPECSRLPLHPGVAERIRCLKKRWLP